MAGAEKLVEKIFNEACLQAEESKKQTEEEASGIFSSVREEAEKRKAAIVEKAETEALDLKKRKLAVAGLEGRKQLLKAKQDMVEEAFLKALIKLDSIPQNEYEDMLAGMIINIAKTGNEEIILSLKDKNRLSASFIGRINDGLAVKGKSGNIRISEETGNFSGGFVLSAEDVEINNSFDALLRMNHDELEFEVVKTLFS